MNIPYKNFDELLDDARKVFHTAEPGQDCPPEDMLFDYVHDDLSLDECRNIKEHINQCEACRVQTLKMDTDRIEWEMRLENDPAGFFGDIFGPDSAEVKDFIEWAERQGCKSESIGERLKESAKQILRSVMWVPEGAGMPATAADVPLQKQLFEIEDRKVEIRCQWGRKKEKPYVLIEWNAENIDPDEELMVEFHDPETGEIFYTASLKKIRKGDKIFKVKNLRFDPFNQKFSISIGVA